MPRNRRWFQDPTRPAYAFDRKTPGADYTVTIPLGGLGEVPIPWHGNSIEEAEQSFLDFLENRELVSELDPRQPPGVWRAVNIIDKGVGKICVFRVDFLPGFFIEKG